MPLEDSYTNKKFRTDDDFVITEKDLYCVGWEAEFGFSILKRLKFYSDPITPEITNNQDSVTQQKNDGSSSRRHNHASDFVSDESHSDKHPGQKHVNTPKNDMRENIDVPSEVDDTAISGHDLFNRDDKISTASTEENIPTDQTDEPIQKENFSRGDRYSVRPNPEPNFSDSCR